MADGSEGAGLLNHLDILTQVGVVGNSTDGQLLGRFLSEPDGVAHAAFTALVARHGPMVLRVCQQLLGDLHDAQDAYQATFLVLALKAGSVRKSDSVASWLHGVARKVAARAKEDASRRRAYERRSAAMRASEHERGADRSEPWPELHEEISRLPERYRQPVVLCYLEGLSTETVAQRLGCPRGTVLSRLSWARERLRQRLTRRGLAPSAALLGTGLSHTCARAAVPARVSDVVIRAATRIAAGGTAAEMVPMSVSPWVRGVLRAMFVTKLKIAATALLLVITGAGGLAYSTPDNPAGRTQGDGAAPKAIAKTPSAPAEREVDLEARTLAIEESLAKPIGLNVPNRTTLEAALKVIKEASKGPDDAGIPIYIDPAGLQEAGAGMNKTIEVVLFAEETPLGANLRRLLRPLGLDYDVHDGLLSISSRDIVVDQKIRRLSQELRMVKEQMKAAR